MPYRGSGPERSGPIRCYLYRTFGEARPGAGVVFPGGSRCSSAKSSNKRAANSVRGRLSFPCAVTGSGPHRSRFRGRCRKGWGKRFRGVAAPAAKHAPASGTGWAAAGEWGQGRVAAAAGSGGRVRRAHQRGRGWAPTAVVSWARRDPVGCARAGASPAERRHGCGLGGAALPVRAAG